MTWISGACLPQRSPAPRMALGAARWWWQLAVGIGLAYLWWPLPGLLWLSIGALVMSTTWLRIYQVGRFGPA